MNLPELEKKISQEVILEREKDKEHWLRLQRFVSHLNTPVEKEKLEDHPVAKGVKYLPISYTEMALDKFFFGLWKTTNFKWEVILDEVVGSIELEVFHPIEKVWISRAGTAAIRIMVDKTPDELKGADRNKWALNTDNKKPDALSMGGMGTLKAECFKNAVQSLGAYLGREVNRKISDTYDPLLTDDKKAVARIRKELSDALESVQDQAMKEAIINSVVQAEEKGTADMKFYEKMMREVAQ